MPHGRSASSGNPIDKKIITYLSPASMKICGSCASFTYAGKFTRSHIQVTTGLPRRNSTAFASSGPCGFISSSPFFIKYFRIMSFRRDSSVKHLDTTLPSLSTATAPSEAMTPHLLQHGGGRDAASGAGRECFLQHRREHDANETALFFPPCLPTQVIPFKVLFRSFHHFPRTGLTKQGGTSCGKPESNIQPM